MGGFGGGRDSGSGGGSGGPSYSGMSSIGSGGSKSKSKSKSKTTTSFNSNDDRRQNYQATSKTKISKKAKAKVKNDKKKDNTKRFDDSKYEGPKGLPTILGTILDKTGLAKKGFDVNKAYYEKNVVGKNNYTKSPEDFKRYMASRGSGKVDALGRPTNGSGAANGSGNDNKPKGIELAKSVDEKVTEVQKDSVNKVKGPTTIEMSAADINVSNKRKGRRATNMTAKKTLTKDFKLSKKTLLG